MNPREGRITVTAALGCGLGEGVFAKPYSRRRIDDGRDYRLKRYRHQRIGGKSR